MKYADIKELDIQDGEGARVSIYVSGCHFHCKGCHNKEAWDFNYGKEFTSKEIDYIIDLMDNDYISGLSILGGEPLELVNQKGLIPLVNKVKSKFPTKDIWCYTGYDFEKNVLGEMLPNNEFTKDFLNKIDIIVDGQFVEEKKITDLKFRGSFNQRKIDVQASLAQNKLVTMKFGDEARYEDTENKKSNPKIIWITDFTNKIQQSKEIAYTATSNIVINEETHELDNKFIAQKEEIKIAAKGIV
jgi:anaerobic ribonucleoside-triphosphate reductase activating protein